MFISFFFYREIFAESCGKMPEKFSEIILLFAVVVFIAFAFFWLLSYAINSKNSKKDSGEEKDTFSKTES